MNFIKIRFTEWRDAPAPVNVKAQALSEADAAQQKLDALALRGAEVRSDVASAKELLALGDNALLRERLAASVTELDNLHAARKAALTAQAAAGQAAMDAMKAHPRVGSFGYQIIDAATMTVLKLVDEDSLDLPAGAVYGYEVIDANPAPPAWAGAVKELL